MCSLFKRPHHQCIEKLLNSFNVELLIQTQCYFGGGTAIALQLDEYRESLDVDFVCAFNEGYRTLRNTVTEDNLGALLNTDIVHLRSVRFDQIGIRTTLEIDGTPIKVEILSEGRIAIAGQRTPNLPVPTLVPTDLFAEKLLANADRGQDSSVLSRDIIDLAVMIEHWGPIPEQAWIKAREAYGAQIDRAYASSCRLIGNRRYLRSCLNNMQMDEDWLDRLPVLLGCPSSESKADDIHRSGTFKF